MDSATDHTVANQANGHTAIHDPVPAESETGVYGETCTQEKLNFPHRIEQEVYHALTSIRGVKFLSLSIYRMADGVCLDGNLEVANVDLCELNRVALQVRGVNHVLNHLRVCQVKSSTCTPNKAK